MLTLGEFWVTSSARLLLGEGYLAAETLSGVKLMSVELGAGPSVQAWAGLVGSQACTKTLRIWLSPRVWACDLLQSDHRPQDCAPADRHWLL